MEGVPRQAVFSGMPQDMMQEIIKHAARYDARYYQACYKIFFRPMEDIFRHTEEHFP